MHNANPTLNYYPSFQRFRSTSRPSHSPAACHYPENNPRPIPRRGDSRIAPSANSMIGGDGGNPHEIFRTQHTPSFQILHTPPLSFRTQRSEVRNLESRSADESSSGHGLLTPAGHLRLLAALRMTAYKGMFARATYIKPPPNSPNPAPDIIDATKQSALQYLAVSK